LAGPGVPTIAAAKTKKAMTVSKLTREIPQALAEGDDASPPQTKPR